MYRRIRWVVSDKAGLTKLIDQLKRYVDGLIDVLPPTTKDITITKDKMPLKSGRGKRPPEFPAMPVLHSMNPPHLDPLFILTPTSGNKRPVSDCGQVHKQSGYQGPSQNPYQVPPPTGCQTCQQYFRATEISTLIYLNYFSTPQRWGSQDDEFFDQINLTFIFFVATCIRHCLKQWSTGEYVPPNQSEEFRWGTSASMFIF